MRVALLGATGETGTSILNGLLASTDPKYEITALIRPSSLQKPEIHDLEKRGVRIASVDLGGPEDEITKQLTGHEVVISAIVAEGIMDQIPLANAAKTAGVPRFVPCFFGTVMPARGMLWLRDKVRPGRQPTPPPPPLSALLNPDPGLLTCVTQKEDVLNHVQTLYLPYTVIDVGWWYQISLPRLPSGKINAVASPFPDWIAGDGTVLSGMTDLRDIGKYVARIIADPRTLNQKVFAYTELLSQNDVYGLVERLSGERVEREYVSPRQPTSRMSFWQSGRPRWSAEDMESRLDEAKNDEANIHKLSVLQYRKSWGLRGDNTPEYARYLGYQIGKDLYPDLVGNSFEDFCKEALECKVKPIYEKKRQEAIAAAAAANAKDKVAEN
ncbi:Isoflavone reductase family protein [Colletotrichum higginsianum IMI 349063]|uniref:Isoflavone reductase family protein n=2 Tax=Colletotrichum higginsianum (strain IMI 349063) TaxID=759273 RepID=A0A1B7Y3T2_COLHI|nr:Isoflavone reductase family protein [Colletotrichum higginsianum IMI 349063]OBR06679.1 Isoflavone reductase family protein [Colletotrichum higginsianum IMI 349063]